MAKVFISYSHADEELRNELEKHLAALRHQGVITVWHDRRIEPGEELHRQIAAELQVADIVLLLVSADFLGSEYCYEVEMQQAIERHDRNDARVIPVILRPCDWQGAPFGKLMAVPRDGKPVTKHASLDDGFLEVAQAVRQAAESCVDSIPRASHRAVARGTATTAQTTPKVDSQRSSNLAVPKEFTDRERDEFLTGGFEYLARYFENSLDELDSRNDHVETRFHQADANRFEAVAYVNGCEEGRCGVWVAFGGNLGAKGIFFSHTGITDGNSYNESLSVHDDGFTLHLKPLGFSQTARKGDHGLTFEGAAECYWTLFVEDLR